MRCLELHYTASVSGALQVHAVLREEAATELVVPATEVGSMDEGTAVGAMYNRAVGVALEVADREPGVPRAGGAVALVLRERVQPAARALAAYWLPQRVQEWLEPARKVTHVQVVTTPEWLGVPFEACWWLGDHLGFRLAVARRLVVAHRGRRVRLRSGRRLRAGVLADPGRSLGDAGATVARELEAVWNRVASAGMGEGALDLPEEDFLVRRRQLEAQDLFDWLRRPDLAVLLGHNDRNESAAGGGGSGLRLGPDRCGSAAEWLGAVASSDTVPWLVAALMCESGHAAEWAEGWRKEGPSFGWADVASRLGVPQFVGTLAEVHATHAVLLVEPLLRALAEGHSAGEALRLARRRLRGDSPDVADHGGTLPALAVMLCGEGTEAVVSAGGNRLDYNEPRHPLVAWCGQESDGRPCDRAILGDEAGFVLRRCAAHQPRSERKRARCSGGHECAEHEVARCGHEGCRATFCSDCHGAALERCWQHASDAGRLIRHPAEAVVCRDPDVRHRGAPRMVHILDDGYLDGLCSDCLRATRRRVDDAGAPF